VRADRVLSQLMEAYEHGDLVRVEAFASRLAAAHPELMAWSTYVRAGCRALSGEPEAGLGLLAAADARGEWWSPTLLGDPALASIWPLDRLHLRARAEERWRAAQACAEVSWEVVQSCSPPAAVIVALHGNGPAPAHLFGPLWVQLSAHATFLVRSSQLVACNVYEWRDRSRAIADVRTVAAAARAAFGSSVPLILAGLGAGGRIAIDAALTGAVDAFGAVAFAPHLAPLDDVGRAPGAGNGPRIRILPGGAEPAVASCAAFAEWLRALGFDCTVRHEEGMGHEYPAQFRESVARALESILGSRSERRGGGA
jgi:predicted esterase